MGSVNFRERLAQRIYDSLDIGKSPHIADCIYVPSGKQEQKVYGIKMWRFGYAPQLILGVGNLELERFGELGLESLDGLESMIGQTPQKKGHSLVRMDRQETTCTPVRGGGLFEIRTEARALAEYLRNMSVRSMLVVSSPVFLRRIALVLRRSLRKSGIRLTYVAVPEKISFDNPATRAEIWTEFRKYLLYRLLF